MTPPADQINVFRCARCERRAERPSGAPPPECGEYVPPTRQRFPDGSWIAIGEGYTPHGPMEATGEVLVGNPLAKVRDAADAARGRRLERAKAQMEGATREEAEAALNQEVPRGVYPWPGGTRVVEQTAAVMAEESPVTAGIVNCTLKVDMPPSLAEDLRAARRRW